MNDSLEARLRATLNVIPAHTGSWAFDATGFEYWSPELFEIHGLEPDGKAPTTPEYIALVHPDDREFVAQEIRKMLADHGRSDFTKRIVRPDGAIRYVRCIGTPATNGHGFVGTGIDVTEQEELTQELRKSVEDAKRAKDRLAEQEKELRQALDYLAEAGRLSHTGTWAVKNLDGELAVVYWSEESYRIYGLDPRQPLPTRVWVWQQAHPDDRYRLFKETKEAQRQRKDFLVQFRLLLADGTVKYVESIGHHVFSARGELLEILGTHIDVTERKRVEEALRRNEHFLAEAQRLSHTGSFGWKPDDGEIVWSEETYRIIEYDSALKPTVDSVVQRVHPDDRVRTQQVIDLAVQTGTDFEHEYRLLMADGRVKHVHAIAHAVPNASGSREFIGAVTDITERKTAEERIREQEAELRQVLDLAPQLVAVLGPNLERLYANSGALAYFGTTLDGWRRNNVTSEVHPDELEGVKAAAERGLLTRSAYEMEKRIRGSDGTYRWFLARYKPVCDNQGQATRWYVACTDIEDRKRTEERLQEENVALREEIDKTSMFEEIVGASPALTAVLSLVSKVAVSDSTVLITGETGTGKELVARAIHRRSGRSSQAFVAVNCAAIPRDLIASELFGHEKGAFTGALQRRLGRFELANGGTIFLDEVAELSPDTQAALLRVLQERELERVGGRETIHVDVRVIAATNRDLIDAVASGTFREDLLYRLNVFPLEMPSLRDRKQDIPVLVEYFIHRYARKAHKTFRRVSKKTLDRLQSYPWPGNVRELQNVIERSVIVCDTDEFNVDESWLSTGRKVEGAGALSSKLSAYEKAIIEEALRASGGQVFGPTGAAARLRIPRSTLESRIRALRINKSRFRPRSPHSGGR
ncbi:MAG: Formate hydrogenlyase transcriptional activator [Gammaproteobacteria bacterium]|nr:Formate hydrogenlyase transcriptional activator [Gammaproteobacteria bacterium]